MKLRVTVRVVAAVVASTLLLGNETGVQAAGPGGVADAFQLNAVHDGHGVVGMGAPPLTRRWRRDLGGAVSYPVIADNRVFVTVRAVSDKDRETSPPVYGTVLRALDARTGRDLWKPVELGGRYWWSALTLGQGKVFALNFEGGLTAFSARTGKRVWSMDLPGQNWFLSPPTYRGGVIYTGGHGSGGTAYAVDAATGRFVWRRVVAGGSEASPAVTATGVYFSLADDRSYRFDLRTGAPTWTRNPSCMGCAWTTPAVAAGSLWIRDSGAARVRLDDGTLSQKVEMGGPTPPAFLGRTAFFVTARGLQARSVTDLRRVRWTFRGDRTIVSAPIVVDGFVYVTSEGGRVYAVDPATGRQVWSAALGAPGLSPNEGTAARPLSGLAAAQGILVVPTSRLLVVYGR